MSKHFGKTWWGQQWLNALNNLDENGRLSRGSTYARKGAVSSMKIQANQVNAKVEGSQSKPYSIKIVVPRFEEKAFSAFIKELADKPSIISKLMNRELEPELLEIANKNGLSIFPKNWDDLGMSCSCPDWVIPCKHLAAVIYQLSTEVDNDPFLLFSLHGADIHAAFKKENILIKKDNDVIPELYNLLSTKAVKPKDDDLKKTQQLPKLVFSSLPSITEPLIQLLADAPVFYPLSGNFRIKYQTELNQLVNAAHLIAKGSTPIAHYFEALKNEPLTIKHHSQLSLHLNGNNHSSALLLNDNNKDLLSIERIIPALWQIPPSHIEDYHESVQCLKTSLLLALNLLANGAIIPQLIKLNNKRYTIRWLPALINKEVQELVEGLKQQLCPSLFYFTENEETKEVSEEVEIHLLSVWLHRFVKQLYKTAKTDLYIGLFFDGLEYAFHQPGEQAISGGIHQWLQKYYLSENIYKPSLVVEEIDENNFSLEIYITENLKSAYEKISLYDLLNLKKYEAKRFNILQSLTQLSSFIPGLENLINRRGEGKIEMNTAEFGKFMIVCIPAIQLLNISVELPKSLQNILRPKASISLKKKSEGTSNFVRLDSLLDFDWKVALGGTQLSEKEFKKLLKTSEGLIRYKSNYFYVSPEDLERLNKHFTSPQSLSASELLRVALSNDYYGAGVSLSDEVKELVKKLTEQSEIPLPKGIQATLRPYQLRGYSWLYRNTQIGFGSVLADDMGLGKTLQVITTLMKYKEEGTLKKSKALIITPTGLLPNWQSEMEKFAPELRFQLYHGPNRELDKKATFDVLLTSYGIARTDADKLKKLKWHVLITDEAQNIKNHDTAQSKAIKSIPANTFIAMSGTPVENRLSELWSIMDFCNRNFLGSAKEFKDNFGSPIQIQNDLDAAEKLKVITSPFIMRRLKSDKSIINDLPDKIEMDCFGTLTTFQAGLYEKTLENALNQIEGIQSKDHKSLFARQGLVLQMIMALKQICNHPTQFLKNNVLDASLSGKMELLFDKLDGIIENNEKVLIFTQFTEMGNLLKHFIEERFGEEPLFYHGGCSLKQRSTMVNNFQNNKGDKIFILSLKAAGTGLNLTAANHVIHYDLWWNPAVESQATDRAYRIGQTSNVMVHRFITKSTFEEKINAMIQSKKKLADMTVATGENWIGNLSNTELKNIFELNMSK